MSHYAQPAGTSDFDQYFMDVEIGPASVKDGSLRARFDSLAYPAVGVLTGLSASHVALTASSTTPVHGTSVTLTATCAATAPGTDVPTGLVTFKDGTTSLGTATPNGSGVATLTVAGGLTTGAHSLTAALAADSNVAASTSPVLTVTAS